MGTYVLYPNRCSCQTFLNFKFEMPIATGCSPPSSPCPTTTSSTVEARAEQRPRAGVRSRGRAGSPPRLLARLHHRHGPRRGRSRVERRRRAHVRWSREEAVGRLLGELIVPEELRQRHQEGLARAARTGESRIMGQRLRLPALRKDGSTFTSELAITKLERGGRMFFTGTLGPHRIVLAEEQRAAAEMRYRSLIENIPLVTYMNSADAPTRSLYMSPQVESLLGYTADAWAKRLEVGHDGIHPDDRERVVALALDARELGAFPRAASSGSLRATAAASGCSTRRSRSATSTAGRKPPGLPPRNHRAEATRGAVAAFAEDGSGRPARRRHRARLQQHADGDHRLYELLA